MGEFSIWHWLVLIVIVMLLFGRGKISDLMGDVAGGIKAFKKGMAADDEPAKEPARPEAAKATKAVEHRESAEVPQGEAVRHTESTRG
jgi:sec-independent protein translocase protein TatA